MTTYSETPAASREAAETNLPTNGAVTDTIRASDTTVDDVATASDVVAATDTTADAATPSNNALPKAYDPRGAESRWYPLWLAQGFFHAEDKAHPDNSFSMVIPPPNVTGALHIGHALDNTLQDIIVRARRMQGLNTCWMPGTDHAGIATQNVVERALAAEGSSRHAIGREAFVERVWVWKKEYGDRIIYQLQRLGASCDWDRLRFTMDDGCSRAVKEVFTRLYNDGLIYRDEYLINWCPRCLTALSDLEVEHEERDGSLWHIRYPWIDAATGGDVEMIVATTRPETLLGDVAVAVHPDDERYQALIGRMVVLPLTGRQIPIIADARVDRTFGTGVVKITPAHDANDFRMGNDHNLPRINIFTPDAKLNEKTGPFEGLDRFAAREKIVTLLTEQNLLVQTDAHRHAVGQCYRCKTVVEPSLSLQWFVKTKPLATRALAAVKKSQTKIFPKTWEKTFFDWMERMQDWCISRQIWWGHRIPAWYCPNALGRAIDGGRAATGCPPIVGLDRPTHCPHCKSAELTQDEDVLDTWFSSALWPFSTFGWPDNTQSLKTFYPTSLLVTGFDIIFFWVARMMMMGMYCMNDVPFRHVYLHALIRDPLGQKMSKSKGNVIDPVEMIDKFGADAMRFTLAALSAQGRDIKLSEDRIEGYKHFCNKLWNAARFMFMHCATYGDAVQGVIGDDADPPTAGSASLADRWVVHQLQVVTREVSEALDAYEFDRAASALYRFVWHEFCDWYVEAAKIRLNGTNADAKRTTLRTMSEVFEATLRLLHPFMPFLTEELWQQLRALKTGRALPDTGKFAGAGGNAAPTAGLRKAVVQYPAVSQRIPSIVVAAWPTVTKRPQHQKEAKQFEVITQIVSAIRTIRSEHQIPPVKRVAVIVRVHDDIIQKLLGTHGIYLRELARLERLEIRVSPVQENACAIAVAGGVEIYVPLAGLIDIAAERTRLAKELEKTRKQVDSITAKLANPDFAARAPAEIVDAEQTRLTDTRAELEKLEAVLARLNAANVAA